MYDRCLSLGGCIVTVSDLPCDSITVSITLHCIVVWVAIFLRFIEESSSLRAVVVVHLRAGGFYTSLLCKRVNFSLRQFKLNTD